MWKRIATLSLAVGLSTGLACVDFNPDEETEPDDTGVSMTVDVQSYSEVDGMRFTVFACGDDEALLVEDRYLEDMTLPEAMNQYAGDPFDEDSQHFFAHHFAKLDSGCYDVMVEAIIDGSVAEHCEAAQASDVDIAKDMTTEILLVSQCEATDLDGDKSKKEAPHAGNLDVVGAINHAPKIKYTEVLPSMELTCPDATVELCTTVYEPDKDPVAFEWLQLEGPEPVSGPEETLFHEVNGFTEKCVEYELPNESADYLFELTVFDYFQIDGELITAEQWYLQEDYGEIESRDTMTVPLTVDCPDDVLGEIEDKKYKDDKKEEKEEEEDVLAEVEDKKDKEEEDVLDVIEEKTPEEIEKKEKEEEDVLEEIEDKTPEEIEKKEKEEEDVLEEIEDKTPEEIEKKEKEEEEDVLEEIEDKTPEEIEKKEKEDNDDDYYS